MNKLTVKLLVLFLFSSVVYAQVMPAFKKQIIQVPMNNVDQIWSCWKDINKDGLTDLLVLVQEEKKAFTYIQDGSGFSKSLNQTITFPPHTMWLTLFDVNEHPGNEMLISTSQGLVYYLQNNGIFEIEPVKLLDAEQVIPQNHPPIIIEPDKWPDDQKDTIPFIFGDHTDIYKLNENYQLQILKTVPHEYTSTVYKYNWNNWNIGSGKTAQIRIGTVAHQKTETIEEEKPEEENVYIEKTVEKIEKESDWWGDHGREEKDINGDGRKDLVLWYFVGDIDVKTSVIVFVRRENGKLPEKPDQILRCSGMPINFDFQNAAVSLFYDLDNDGALEIVLAELKTKPVSAGDFVETATTKGIEWTLSVRKFDGKKGYSDKADFKFDVKTALPIWGWIEDLITFEGDYNADGRTDIIVKRSSDELDLYLSSPNGELYKPQAKLQLQSSTENKMFVEDLNNDGISDIYLIDYEMGQITVFLSESLK